MYKCKAFIAVVYTFYRHLKFLFFLLLKVLNQVWDVGNFRKQLQTKN